MIHYRSFIVLLMIAPLTAVAGAWADHVPVQPRDLLISPPEQSEPTRNRWLNLSEPPTTLDEAERRLRQKERDEANARAAEQAQRKAMAADLPLLSDDRNERLDALFGVLQTARNAEQLQKAETEIMRVWNQSGSPTIDLLLGWANAAMEKKQYGAALDYLDNIIRLKPDFAEGWNRRATLYFLQQNYARSIADVERTLALEPRHFGALGGLGLMLRELGHDEEALFALKKAFEVNPTMNHIKDAINALEKEIQGRSI